MNDFNCEHLVFMRCFVSSHSTCQSQFFVLKNFLTLQMAEMAQVNGEDRGDMASASSSDDEGDTFMASELGTKEL